LQVKPTEVVTDAAGIYLGVLDELTPQAWHHVERYANNGWRLIKASSNTDGHLSAGGHHWAVQANVPDYLEKAFGGFVRSYPYNAGNAMTYTER
jgi:hypothetical protein